MPGGHKKAAELARRIESEIMRRAWPVGESLGSEPELVARYKVSRAVFREAVRIVEHNGAALMRRGPGRGLVVSAPEMGAVEQAATLYLDYADVSPQDLFDVRSALELACTRLVSENLTSVAIARLREVLANEGYGRGDVETRRSHDLHTVIADLTGNAAMRLFVETLSSVTEARIGHQQLGPEEFRQVHAAHQAIVEAMISGDAPLAGHRMRLHLAAAATFYHRRHERDTRKNGRPSRLRAPADRALPGRRG